VKALTPYEILTIIIASVGAVTGIASLWRTHVLARKQLEYQAIAAALAKRQLEALIRQENAENRADLTVDLVKVTSTDFRFVVSNRGLAAASDVNVEVDPSSPDNPMVQGERAQKLPFPRLDSGQSFTLIAALHLRSAMQYSLHLTWRDPGGRIERRDAHVAL
jgi:hypothetical protein